MNFTALIAPVCPQARSVKHRGLLDKISTKSLLLKTNFVYSIY